MVGGLGSTTAAPDAGAGTRGDFDPPRQPTCRFLGLCADWSRRRRPPPGGERGDVPPLDACAPPPAASAAPSGGGLRLSRAPDPPTLRVAASLTGLPPVALGPPGGERGDVPPLDAGAPPSAASAADSGGGLRLSRAGDPPTPRVAASLTGLPPVALGRPRGVSPPPGGERGDVPPLDAGPPPSAASAADSGGELRLSRAPDPPIPRVVASLTGLPPVALGPPGGERGDVPPLDAGPPPSAASAADPGGGLRVSRGWGPMLL